MKVKKKYSFTNGKTIWRLIPSGNKLLIEEMNQDKKQVFFSCLDIETGKSILRNFRPDENFWVGVEAFENNRIYFHRFVKPDMPGHIGIIVYDLDEQKILWNREDLVFLFLYEDRVFAFLQKFEAREFFSLNAESGSLIKNYGENVQEINKLREELQVREYEKYKDYLFPEVYSAEKYPSVVQDCIEEFRQYEVISGPVEFIRYKDVLLLSYHTVTDDGKMNNNFRVIEINTGKLIFKDVVNSGITSYIPDSFFVKNNLLFLIKHKTELLVCLLD